MFYHQYNHTLYKNKFESHAARVQFCLLKVARLHFDEPLILLTARCLKYVESVMLNNPKTWRTFDGAFPDINIEDTEGNSLLPYWSQSFAADSARYSWEMGSDGWNTFLLLLPLYLQRWSPQKVFKFTCRANIKEKQQLGQERNKFRLSSETSCRLIKTPMETKT